MTNGAQDIAAIQPVGNIDGLADFVEIEQHLQKTLLDFSEDGTFGVVGRSQFFRAFTRVECHFLQE